MCMDTPCAQNRHALSFPMGRTPLHAGRGAQEVLKDLFTLLQCRKRPRALTSCAPTPPPLSTPSSAETCNARE